jgi:hypothetical protein
VVSAQVAIDPGCTRGHPDNPQVSRGLMTQDPGAINAIGKGARVHQQADQSVELLLEALQVPAKGVARLRRQIAGHSAQRDGPPQQPRAEQLVLQPDEAFAECLCPTGRDGKRDVCCECTDVCRVVVEALQFQQHHPERTCARRYRDFRQTFDGVRVRERVANRGVSGD